MQALNTFNVFKENNTQSIKQGIVDKNASIEKNGLARTILYYLVHICTVGVYHGLRDRNEFAQYRDNMGAIRNGLVKLRNSGGQEQTVRLSNGESIKLKTVVGQGSVIFSAGGGDQNDASEIEINRDIDSIINTIDDDVEANPAHYGEEYIAAFKLSKWADDMIAVGQGIGVPPTNYAEPDYDNIVVGEERPTLSENATEAEREKYVFCANVDAITANLVTCLRSPSIGAAYHNPVEKLSKMFGTHATKCLDIILTGAMNPQNWDTFQLAFKALERLPPSRRVTILGELGAAKFDLVAIYFKSIKDEAKLNRTQPRVSFKANILDKFLQEFLTNSENATKEQRARARLVAKIVKDYANLAPTTARKIVSLTYTNKHGEQVKVASGGDNLTNEFIKLIDNDPILRERMLPFANDTVVNLMVKYERELGLNEGDTYYATLLYSAMTTYLSAPPEDVRAAIAEAQSGRDERVVENLPKLKNTSNIVQIAATSRDASRIHHQAPLGSEDLSDNCSPVNDPEVDEQTPENGTDSELAKGGSRVKPDKDVRNIGGDKETPKSSSGSVSQNFQELTNALETVRNAAEKFDLTSEVGSLNELISRVHSEHDLSTQAEKSSLSDTQRNQYVRQCSTFANEALTLLEQVAQSRSISTNTDLVKNVMGAVVKDGISNIKKLKLP